MLAYFVDYMSNIWSNECQMLEATNKVGYLVGSTCYKSFVLGESLANMAAAMVEQSSLCAF